MTVQNFWIRILNDNRLWHLNKNPNLSFAPPWSYEFIIVKDVKETSKWTSVTLEMIHVLSRGCNPWRYPKSFKISRLCTCLWSSSVDKMALQLWGLEFWLRFYQRAIQRKLPPPSIPSGYVACVHTCPLTQGSEHGWACHNYLRPVPTLVVFKLLNLPEVRAQVSFYKDLFF